MILVDEHYSSQIEIMDDPTELKSSLLSVVESSKNAISEDEVAMRMSNVDKASRVRALNALINENKIRVITIKSKIFYEPVIEEKSLEDIVLEVIKESDKNGIWIRDIRFKTKASQIMLNKALKSLENKKLIRSIKAISNRKLYVLFDLQPDETITGGACYESGFIREDIVKNLKSTCLQHLYDLYKNSYDQIMVKLQGESFDEIFNYDKVYATASDVFNMFKERKLFQDTPRVKLNDIENILNVLFFECKLLKIQKGDKLLFRYNPFNRDKFDLFYSPCIVCPHYKDCRPSSVNISPENCRYIHYEQF